MTAFFAQVAASAFGFSSPGVFELISVAVVGGLFATLFVVAVSYYGTLAAVRLGFDPDTYGIPLVTSVLDLAGAFTFIGVVELLGIL